MARSTTPPRYLQVREAIRRNIETKVYQPGSKLPPETELFRQLDASNTTVVRALKDLVREGLIVRRRGSGTFVAERQHPPLIPGRILKLGILWYQTVHAHQWGQFCHRVSAGAMRAWGMTEVEPELDADRGKAFSRAVWRQPARGLTVECLGNEWSGEQRAPSLEAVRQSGFDGLITVGIVEEEWLDRLLALNIPTIIADFPTQRFSGQADLVYADPQSGYRAAVDYFVAQGLRRMHFVGALIGNPDARVPDPRYRAGYRLGKRIDPDTFLRQSAWRQAMDAHGLETPEEGIHYLEQNDQKLAARWAALPEDERPQAVLCHDVGQAERLIEACAAYGISMQAAGACDRTVIGRAHNILLDSEQMGEVAGDLILMRLKQPNRPLLNVGVRMVFNA